MDEKEQEATIYKAEPITNRKIISSIKSRDNEFLEIIRDKVLNHHISTRLPNNYNFEIHQIIWKIRKGHIQRVALQFPEGLFIFSNIISDIIEKFTEASVITIGDVSYGACCIEDYVAELIGCQLIIHFAHSCLIPSNLIIKNIKVFYVHVDIKFDIWHFIETIKYNFPNRHMEKIALCGTIQFISTLQSVCNELNQKYQYNIFLPQIRPLSRGEVLGCTAPKLQNDVTAVLFVADGRFHLEAIMIANPQIKNYYRYNPYDKQITREFYAFDEMIKMRNRNIRKATTSLKGKGILGIIMGTLGHQGNAKVVENLKKLVKKKNPNFSVMVILIPEIKANILKAFDKIDVWVQTSCPRLSIDWGDNFIEKPLLNPYELNIALGNINILDKELLNVKDTNSYPMDYYASQSIGNWTPNHRCNKNCFCK